MNIEQRPFTLNDHYYADYKATYLSLYRSCRQKDNNNQVMVGLHEYNFLVYNSYNSPSTFQNGIMETLQIPPQVGITDTQALALAKFLSLDPMEPALNIMAGVRAYFQGSKACAFQFCDLAQN